MIDKLRTAWRQPLSRRGGRLLFITAAIVITCAGAGFAMISDPAREHTPAPAPARDQPTDPDEPTAAAEEPYDEVVRRDPDFMRPKEDGRRTPSVIDRPEQADAPRAAARRFLTGYLPYTYGNARVDQIRSVSAELRQDLAARPPRIPPAEQNRKPRVLLVHGSGVGLRRAGMVAAVDDGARTYTVQLELVRERSGWHVVALGPDTDH